MTKFLKSKNYHSLGIIGFARGKKIIDILDQTKLNYKVSAIFDPNLKLKKYKGIKIYNLEKEFYKYSNFTNVYIASPVKFHASQTHNAIKNNKNILCEIPAFKKISEGIKIQKKLKEKKLIYCMAENYCFLPQIIALKKLHENLFFGDIVYVRSGYIHDCKNISFKKKKLTWRGIERKNITGNDYPTHSLGPICKLLRNKRLANIFTFSSSSKTNSIFFKKKFPNFNFKRPDISLSHVYTKDKILIDLICDTTSSRPSSMADLYIQGTKGIFISGRYDGENSLISNDNKKFKKFNFKNYLRKDELKKIKKLKKFYPMYKILENFQMVLDKKLKEPYINFKDAFLWSSVIELSKKSLICKKEIEFKYLRN